MPLKELISPILIGPWAVTGATSASISTAASAAVNACDLMVTSDPVRVRPPALALALCARHSRVIESRRMTTSRPCSARRLARSTASSATMTCRIRLDAQQVERGQQHAGRAEAALQAVVAPEGRLQRMERAVLHQALDGRDLGAVGLHRQHQARARGLAVHQHRAGAADAVLAADVRAGEREVLPQEVDEQLADGAPPGARHAVDREPDRRLGHDVAPAIARFSARTVSTPVR